MPKQGPTPQPTPTPHDEPAAQADYLRSLLAQAPADVRTRLAEIGEIALSENLAEMRNRQLRDPGTPSRAVEHTDHLAPGAAGDPDVPSAAPGTRNHRAAALPDLHPRWGLCDRLAPRG